MAIPGIKGPTLKQIYHAYMDTMRDGRDVVERAGADMDYVYCDLISTIIDIPGVKEAVIVEALKNNYYLNEFSPETVGDIPFQFVWDVIMNPGDLGLEETSN